MAKRLAQTFVNPFHIAPERIATGLRYDLATQDSIFRRVLAKCRVGMPDIGRKHRIVLVIVEHQDFRKLALRPEGMHLELRRTCG